MNVENMLNSTSSRLCLLPAAVPTANVDHI